MNKNVTLDMVKCVLDKLPDLISWDTHVFDDNSISDKKTASMHYIAHVTTSTAPVQLLNYY